MKNIYSQYCGSDENGKEDLITKLFLTAVSTVSSVAGRRSNLAQKITAVGYVAVTESGPTTASASLEVLDVLSAYLGPSLLTPNEYNTSAVDHLCWKPAGAKKFHDEN